MSVQFWIASHIGSNDRLIMLKGMLASIALQTVRPDHVWISISHDPSISLPTNEEIKNILGNTNFTTLVSNIKLYQFQHLRRIWIDSKENQAKWVMFCDDDDLNGPERVASFNYVLSKTPNKKVFISGTVHFINNLYRENNPWITDYTLAVTKYKASSTRGDFGSYVCHISILDDFFNEMYDKAMTEMPGTTDLMFMASIPNPICIPGEHYAKRHGSYSRDYFSKKV